MKIHPRSHLGMGFIGIALDFLPRVEGYIEFTGA